MRPLVLAFVGLTITSAAWAETVAAPKIVAGDSWTYQGTVEDRSGWHQTRLESTVVRVGTGSIAISTKPVGSTMPAVEMLTGADWSRMRSVNGRDTVVNRPLAFPLSSGKTWDISYAEENPNRVHSNERWHTTYKVSGWQDVTVPAGTFNALLVEANGEWTATLAQAVSAVSGSRVDAGGATSVMQTTRTSARTASGRTYKAFWYVPSTKRWVKSLEEYFGSNGVQTEKRSGELVTLKVAD